MDYIVQKCEQLGISRKVPKLSARCVSRPDAKSIKKKCERWQKIALQAAMQSRRGIIPQVCDCVSFEKAAQMSLESEKQIIFYELGGEKVDKILDKKLMISADEKRLLYVTVTRAKNILFTDGINDLLEHLNSKNMEISNA